MRDLGAGFQWRFLTSAWRLRNVGRARCAPWIPDDDEILEGPLDRFSAAVDVASIDRGRCALPAPALAQAPIRHHRKVVLFGKHVTVKIEGVAEPTADDHQIRLGLRLWFHPRSFSKDLAEHAIRRAQPRQCGFHYVDVNEAGPGSELKTYTSADFGGVPDELTGL